VTTKQRHIRGTAACLVLCVFAALAFAKTTGQQAANQDQQTADQKDKPKKAEKPYALIFGTAYGPDDRPLYGVKVTIHPPVKKKPRWELMSDHRGEFAQRVPPGPSDYIIHGEAEYAPLGSDGKPQMSKKKKLSGDTKVHVDSQERLDIGLHLTE
jgi:hypothetical protein